MCNLTIGEIGQYEHMRLKPGDIPQVAKCSFVKFLEKVIIEGQGIWKSKRYFRSTLHHAAMPVQIAKAEEILQSASLLAMSSTSQSPSTHVLVEPCKKV